MTTRRQLLKSATALALAAPAVVSASARGADDRPSPSNRINVGCVGVRNMGGNHLKTLLAAPGAQVVGICDVDTEIREAALALAAKTYAAHAPAAAFAGCGGHNDFRELLARPDVDAVVIAVPDHWHAPIAIAACKAGKDVYSEKPLALTIAQGWAMIDAVRRYGRVFQTGTQRRSSPQVRRVCELVRNGRIGKLLAVRCAVGQNNVACGPTWTPEPVPPGFDYEMWLGPAPWEPYHKLRCHYSFRFIRDYSGGQVTNNGAHWCDLAQWAIGADGSGPVEVEGRGEYPTTGLFNTAAKVDFTATYAGGVELHVTTTGYDCRFEGTEGWIGVDNKADPPSILKSAIGPDEVHLYEVDSKGGHMGNFLECVRTRRDPSAPVEVGHRSATVCHLGNIAMLLGRKVNWDPARERFVNDPGADRMLSRAMRAPWQI
jgi:predicted dehydrogenase